MTIDLVRLIIGEVPEQYIILEYTASLIIALFTIKFILEMFIHVLNIINKYK